VSRDPVVRSIRVAFIVSCWTSGLLAAAAANAEVLRGQIGNSDRWGSSWIDFDHNVTFLEGDRLRIVLADDKAKCVLVRLLPHTSSPDSSEGIVGNARQVEPGRIIEITLNESYADIKQLSIHGKEPWNMVLCPNNGPAKLLSVERVSARP
jgi:hypothetical protein